jgi:hypothetical protein
LRTWIALLIAFAGAAYFAWVLDWITPQGERTVYTVECSGRWAGAACEGKELAGKRYRFRALKAHREVLYWTVGAEGEPSGKFHDCLIENGRNWTCKAAATGQPPAITQGMLRGEPLPHPSGQGPAYRQVSKWQWIWLDLTSGRAQGA